jgi:hypothetical protein
MPGDPVSNAARREIGSRASPAVMEGTVQRDQVPSEPPAPAPLQARDSVLSVLLRGAFAGLLLLCAGSAFNQAWTEALDIVTGRGEALPSILAFQSVIGVLDTLAAVGVWKRTRWSVRAVAAAGTVTALFVALLQPLLDLDASERGGFAVGSVAILVVTALLTWLAARNARIPTS